MVKCLIMAVIGSEKDNDNKKVLVYIKGCKKREWLVDIFDSDDLIIENLNADYEDIDFLNNLDV